MKKITTKPSEPYSPKIGERLMIDGVLCEAVESVTGGCESCILLNKNSCRVHIDCSEITNKHGVDIYLKKIEK